MQQNIDTSRRRFPWKWLAAIVVAIVVGVIWYYRYDGNTNAGMGLREKGVAYTSYTGRTGERKVIRLADSTVVILNSASVLLVPQNLPAGNRKLILDGDAFFNVKAASALPFIVKTDKVTATVLGTTFRMRSFAAQQGATVYLLDGKIKVTKSYHSSTDNQPEILERGQMILANKEIDLMEKETYEPEELERWLRDDLSFQEEAWPTVLRRLEDWFGVTIEVKGDLSGVRPVTAQFYESDLEKVMENLHKAYQFSYKIRRNKVIIRF